MKFILFPVLTLLGVIATALMWVSLFHLGPLLESTGISLRNWFWIDVLWTAASGLFSWALSRDIATWSTDTSVFDDTDRDHPLRALILRFSKEIDLKYVPQIGIYPSPEVNLFSAGPFAKRTVLSVSKGFLELNASDQEVLIFAELSKIKNGDTALLVFCHGMTHGFVLYISRLLAFFLGTSFRQTEGSSSSTYPEILVNILTTFLLTLWGSVVVFYLARQRHLRGDSAVLEKFGKDGLSRELNTLETTSKTLEHYDLFTFALKANHSPKLWEAMMASHPSFANRRRLLPI